MARPEALQRLQLRIGSLTRTCPFPIQTGHAPSSIGLPAQNPQVFGEYADIIGRRRKNESLQRFDDFLKGRRVFSKRRKRNVGHGLTRTDFLLQTWLVALETAPVFFSYRS
jgi:hypothetical protein